MRKFLSGLLAVILLSGVAVAQTVNVALPDTSGQVGVKIGLPLTIQDDVTGMGISSVEGQITFDPGILNFEDITLGPVGTGAMVAYNEVSPGVVSFALADSSALEGQGILLYFNFTPIATGYSALSFDNFMFNNGTPEAVTHDGSITVEEAPTIDVSIPTTNVDVNGYVDVPVQVESDITSYNVYSAEFYIEYDPNVVEVDTVVLGDITSGWTLAYNTTTPGMIEIALAGGTSLTGTGNLVVVTYHAVGSDGSYSDLILGGFSFNTGFPFASLHNGRIYVGTPNVLGISFPTLYSAPGGSETICLNVDSNATNTQNVLAFEFTFSYDPNVLTPIGYASGDLIPDGDWTIAVNLNAGTGLISVAGAGSTPITGSGTLICFDFNMNGGECDTSAFTINSFTWNNGLPAVEWTNGRVILSTPPGMPSLYEPLDSAILNNSTPTFVWENTVPTGSYHLLVASDETFTDPVIDVTLTDSTYTATSALNDGSYFWKVSPFSACGREGIISDVHTFTIDATPPGTPTLLSPQMGVMINDPTPVFVWNSVTDNLTGVDHYVLQVDQTPSFSNAIERVVTDTTFELDEQLNDGLYYWRVKAVDVAGNEGSWSSPPYLFNLDGTVPNAPIPISPIGGFIGSLNVTFSWTAVTMPGGSMKKGKAGTRSPVHYVLVAMDSNYQPLVVDTTMETSISKTVPITAYGTVYWFVYAYDEAGNVSPTSDTVSFGIDVTAPQISNTTILHDTTYEGPFQITTEVRETPDLEAGVKEVHLFFQINDGDWIDALMSAIDSVTYMGTIPGPLGPNSHIKYYIKAIDAAEPSNEAYDPVGAPDSVYEFVATGVNEALNIPKNFSFKVSPNPSRGHVTVDLALPTKQFVTVKVYNAIGKLVRTLTSGEMSPGEYRITWNGYSDYGKKVSSGVYFFKVEAGSFRSTKKVIMTRR